MYPCWAPGCVEMYPIVLQHGEASKKPQSFLTDTLSFWRVVTRKLHPMSFSRDCSRLHGQPSPMKSKSNPPPVEKTLHLQRSQQAPIVRSLFLRPSCLPPTDLIVSMGPVHSTALAHEPMKFAEPLLDSFRFPPEFCLTIIIPIPVSIRQFGPNPMR